MSLTFNGITSDSLDLIVERFPSRVVPSRKVEVFSIPGRNGDLTVSQNAWNNAILEYECYVSNKNNGLPVTLPSITSWLSSDPGYLRLEDSYDPSVYRLARFVGGTEVENIFNRYGRCTLEFDAKPQQFLLTGETAVSVSSSDTINNPTAFTALPIITIEGSGAVDFEINGELFQISDVPLSGIVIDSVLEDCYFGSTNLNSLLTLPAYSFPKLTAGTNTITYTGTVTKFELQPNWWRI